MFDELYYTVKNRYGSGNATQGMADWISANTTLNSKKFGYEDYWFQKAIADDMHPDVSVIKCSQIGLALALDTPVPTPTGWTTMGDVRVGDQLFDEQGKICDVTYISPVYTDHDCYEIEFDDGQVITADANHRWPVRASRAFDLSGKYSGRGNPGLECDMFKEGVLDTATIYKHFKYGVYNRFSIGNTKPLDLPEAQLPLDPYYLGVWLGDGNLHASVVTSHKTDAKVLVPALAERGLDCAISSERGDTLQLNVRLPGQKQPGRGVPNSTSSRLRDLGLLQKKKFIPPMYLRASARQRTELLSGLLDTDGSLCKRGRVSFHNTSRELIAGFEELAASLGFKTHTRWRTPSRSRRGRLLPLSCQ